MSLWSRLCRPATAAVLTATAIVLMASPPVATGFGTIEGLGQHSEHEKITRLALKDAGLGRKTLDELAGKRGRLGAVGAPDIRLALDPAAHCDGGDYLDVPGYPQSKADARLRLKRCRAFIDVHFLAAVRDAEQLVDASGSINESEIPTLIGCSYNGSKGRAKCNVLEELGLVFHAAQDFYSHTNWVDEAAAGAAGAGNPPGLGNDQPSPWLDPRLSEPFPDGLISGCFDGIPESAHCNDGGTGAKRVKHQALNKDNGKIDVRSGKIGAGSSERGGINGNFARAVRAAIADTTDKWRLFEQQILGGYGNKRGNKILCVLRSDNPSSC